MLWQVNKLSPNKCAAIWLGALVPLYSQKTGHVGSGTHATRTDSSTTHTHHMGIQWECVAFSLYWFICKNVKLLVELQLSFVQKLYIFFWKGGAMTFPLKANMLNMTLKSHWLVSALGSQSLMETPGSPSKTWVNVTLWPSNRFGFYSLQGE